jgi:type IV pilus assembly protein PilM
MVALFEVGAFTTSMQVIQRRSAVRPGPGIRRAQLTQLIVRQYGFSSKKPRPRSAAVTCRRTTKSGVLKPFVESMVQEIARALQFFFTSTPHNKVDHIMLAGGSAALPGLTAAVTKQTSFSLQLVNPFDGMEVGAACASRK